MTEPRVDLPDRYNVTRRVASGGMATVYAAEDGVLGRLVAVKVLAPHVAADPASRLRFEREARTAARVSDHPNVATIYDVGEHNGNAFIVMELFTGGTVADRLREGVTIPRPQAVHWLEEAAAALDYAHAEDIVHRDVKPANLLLDERGRLAVGDFGIARLADETSLTQVGQIVGTAAYLSPEQAMGTPATPASDRYSLGVVAFELLTGRRPFPGENAAAQARHHVDSPPPDAALGDEVDGILQRMLAKAPDDRYPTCARFVEELRAGIGRDAEPKTAPTRRAPAPAPVPAPDPTPTPAAGRRLAPLSNEPADGRERTPPPEYTRSSAGGGARRGWPLLAALALVALVIAAVAIFGGGDDPPSERADAPAETTRQERADTTEKPADTAEEPAPEETPPAAPETAPDNEDEEGPGPETGSNESPGALNDRGYALLQGGDAEGAVPVLEQAVAGFDQQGGDADPTTFGYALYNLGTAYERVGRYDEAVKMYERRLQVNPDDRPEVVRQAIKRAKKAAKG